MNHPAVATGVPASSSPVFWSGGGDIRYADRALSEYQFVQFGDAGSEVLGVGERFLAASTSAYDLF